MLKLKKQEIPKNSKGYSTIYRKSNYNYIKYINYINEKVNSKGAIDNNFLDLIFDLYVLDRNSIKKTEFRREFKHVLVNIVKKNKVEYFEYLYGKTEIRKDWDLIYDFWLTISNELRTISNEMIVTKLLKILFDKTHAIDNYEGSDKRNIVNEYSKIFSTVLFSININNNLTEEYRLAKVYSVVDKLVNERENYTVKSKLYDRTLEKYLSGIINVDCVDRGVNEKAVQYFIKSLYRHSPVWKSNKTHFTYKLFMIIITYCYYAMNVKDNSVQKIYKDLMINKLYINNTSSIHLFLVPINIMEDIWRYYDEMLSITETGWVSSAPRYFEFSEANYHDDIREFFVGFSSLYINNYNDICINTEDEYFRIADKFFKRDYDNSEIIKKVYKFLNPLKFTDGAENIEQIIKEDDELARYRNVQIDISILDSQLKTKIVSLFKDDLLRHFKEIKEDGKADNQISEFIDFLNTNLPNSELHIKDDKDYDTNGLEVLLLEYDIRTINDSFTFGEKKERILNYIHERIFENIKCEYEFTIDGDMSVEQFNDKFIDKFEIGDLIYNDTLLNNVFFKEIEESNFQEFKKGKNINICNGWSNTFILSKDFKAVFEIVSINLIKSTPPDDINSYVVLDNDVRWQVDKDKDMVKVEEYFKHKSVTIDIQYKFYITQPKHSVKIYNRY